MGETKLNILDSVGEAVDNSSDKITMLDGNDYLEVRILRGDTGAISDTAKGFASADKIPYLFLMNEGSVLRETGIAFPDGTYKGIIGHTGDVNAELDSLFYLGPDARFESEIIIKGDGDAILKRGDSCTNMKTREYVDCPSDEEIYVSVSIEDGNAKVIPGLNHGDIQDKSACNILAQSGIIPYGLKDAGISYRPEIDNVK